MFSGDDFHTVKEALIFVTVWKIIESLVTYLGDKIPALYRARNKAAAMDESGNILFVYDGDPKNKTSPPTEIGFGHVDMKTPGASDLVPPLQWEPFDEAKHDNPCILLFPATT